MSKLFIFFVRCSLRSYFRNNQVVFWADFGNFLIFSEFEKTFQVFAFFALQDAYNTGLWGRSKCKEVL